jgi:hypothetical protein
MAIKIPQITIGGGSKRRCRAISTTIARRCGSDAEKTAEDRSQTRSSGANPYRDQGYFYRH